MISVVPAFANTDTTGGTSGIASQGNGYAYGFPITISASGTLQSIGVNWGTAPTGHVMVALYTAGSSKPGSLIVQSASTAVATSSGWQDISVASTSITAGSYWVAAQIDSIDSVEFATSSITYYPKAYGSFDSTWSSSSTQTTSEQWNMRVTYSTGPPPADFTITANPTPQSVGAGATASYTLTVTYGSSLASGTTVSLSVTSGCPAGVTCTVTPNSLTASGTVTLAVPTLITTPSGTISITVTATCTSPSLTHTVTVQLTISGPGSYLTNVHTGATQVVVTVTWTGTGAASVVLEGPSGSPTLTESGQVIYDRLTYISGSNTPTSIHRVTFNISSYSPSGAQTWTVLVSLSASYTVTIEVS